MYFGISYLHGGKICSGSLDHLFGKINSEDFALRSHKAGGYIEIKAGSTAYVQNGTAFVDPANDKGIADAAKGVQQLTGNLLKKLLVIA